MTLTEGIQTHEIIPGRAMVLLMKNADGTPLSILGVYAPNNPVENAEFWENISRFFERHPRIRKPDVMAGDMNMVEAAIDRLPAHEDNNNAVDALDNLKSRLNMMDGWRETYPDTREYTFRQPSSLGGSLSRIDRIYVKSNVFNQTFEWGIKQVGIETDHDLVWMMKSTAEAPTIGRGRWAWPTYLIKDKPLMEYIQQTGLEMQTKIESMTDENWTPSNNAQTEWVLFKKKINEKARARSKAIAPKIIEETARLEHQLKNVFTDKTMPDDEKHLNAATLIEKLAMLQKKRYRSSRLNAQIQNKIHGETISRYWSKINKPSRPRDIILRLTKPNRSNENENEEQYETNSKKMANLARDYHDKLQNDRRDIDVEEREHITTQVLGRTQTQTTDEQNTMLRKKITRNDVEKALKCSANFKAPGLDGIPYELWKVLEDRCRTAENTEEPAFDVLEILRKVYNDIEKHGMVRGTNFAESWMCPLYKKNDKTNIANYRPISLLNTDYKIFTKALSMKLADVAPELIHPNQAGFVKGRQIKDQIWLTKRIIELAEATEQNGVIVALDQEKAYDKIEHNYLWKALQSYGIPDEFINTIKYLYNDAHTYVILNGEKSQYPFQVTRGVRQGDPLSCLLFNLAIEPLAEALRQSDLKGIKIDGVQERLIATLFADDTVVYLDWLDDFGKLLKIIDEWCIASGARFNINKTEMIPIGSIGHRDKVRANQFVNGINGTMIPDHIRIAKEGEPVRCLGAWIGNKVEQVNTWNRTLEKIDKSLNHWDQGNPSMEGRRLIILMVVGGMTQYLATVQGMPKEVEARLEKRIRKFLWAEKDQPTVNQETVYAPAGMGGRDLLDIVARNETIAIMWLKTYLSFGPDRPLWCFVTDKILAHHISSDSDSDNVEESVRINSYLQSWKHKVSTGKIGQDLAKMTETGSKNGIQIETIAVSREIMENMPIWHHAKANAPNPRFWATNVHVVRCLKEKHHIKTVCDAMHLAHKLGSRRHTNRRDCRCNSCQITKTITKCNAPHKCFQKAKDMLDTLDPKWDPRKEQPEDHEDNMIPQTTETENGEKTQDIDQRTTTKGTIKNIFRIFTDGETNISQKAPIREHAPNPEEETDETIIYTDGSAINNGRPNAEAGSGIWFGENDERNRALKVPRELNPSNQVAELLAVKEAVEMCPPGAPLLIKTDSMYTINALTKGLAYAEDHGFVLTDNGDLVKTTITKIRNRQARTRLTWVKGHSGIEGNEQADRLAEEGRKKPDPDIIDTQIDTSMILPGARLQAMTQSSAYKIIKKRKLQTERYQDALDRKATKKNIEIATDATAETGTEATEEQIWRSTRHKDVSRSVRYFLWMIIHDAYKVGRHWSRIPGHHEKASCSKCGEDVIENMEHILFQCETQARITVWELAEEMWRKKTEGTLEPSMGKLMACGAIKLEDKGRTRLHRILISESAHLIWRMRCERVIQGKDEASANEVKNRWLNKMNTRLLIDCSLTNTAKYGSKGIKASLVRKTWAKTLLNEVHLPADWTKGGGVLVGIG